MKKTFRIFMMTAVAIATLGLAACGDDNESTDNDVAYYALQYEGRTLADGDTIFVTPSRGACVASVYIENTSDQTLTTRQGVQNLEGDATLTVCYNGECPPSQDNLFALEPGIDPVKSLIEIHVEDIVSDKVLYRIRVGEGDGFAHGVRAYLRIAQ